MSDIVGGPKWWKDNPGWPTAAILEIKKQVYLSHFWTDFHQISFADRHLPYECNLNQKLQFANIQDGGGRHLRFWVFGHILVVNEDICFKFGTMIDIDRTRLTVTRNPSFIKI